MYDKNWRLKIGKKHVKGEFDWHLDLLAEYVEFIEKARELAIEYDWNLWGGGRRNHAITLFALNKERSAISIRLLSSHDYQYYASFEKEINPNNVPFASYTIFAGQTMEEALEYVRHYMIKNPNSNPSKHPMICDMGGAYERYPLEMKWARENALEEFQNKICN